MTIGECNSLKDLCSYINDILNEKLTFVYLITSEINGIGIHKSIRIDQNILTKTKFAFDFKF